MPARNQRGFPSPDQDPDENIVPAELVDDESLWLLLNTYADGEASIEETLYVESLLRSHPGVAREFAFLEMTADSVREFGEVEPPAELTDAIFAATARRKTLFQRACTWWNQSGSIFGPVPLRLGGAALASGVLAVVLWSQMTHVYAPRVDQAPPQVTVHQDRPGASADLARREPKAPKAVAFDPNRFIPMEPDYSNPASLTRANTHDQMLVLQRAIDKSIAYSPPVAKVEGVKPTDRHRDSSTNIVKPDPLSTSTSNSFARANSVEERHMAADGDTGGKTAKPDELGADFDPATEPHVEEIANAAATVSSDEPPTTVTAVSYRPGSISDKTRNAPPAVQSLYMRTQEAIRRQHEIQQYGGYGKDAYNNIQRGEVGLSLVGGRF